MRTQNAQHISKAVSEKASRPSPKKAYLDLPERRRDQTLGVKRERRSSSNDAIVDADAVADPPSRPALYTVNQFAETEPAFTSAALRNLAFKAGPRHSSKGGIPGNGLIECGAIVRIGRKVLIHRERFLNWVSNQQLRGAK